jgi:hypothetical protein
MNGFYTFPMSAWISFVNTVAETSLERMQEMSERIQKRQYTPNDIITDTLGYWIDGVNGWWGVVQQSAAGPVPFAFIKMASDDESATTELAIRKSGGDLIKATPLARLSDSGEGEVSVTLDATWATDKPNCVVVHVYGLNAEQVDADKKLREGLYQSSLHMNNKLVGIVQVLVED